MFRGHCIDTEASKPYYVKENVDYGYILIYTRVVPRLVYGDILKILNLFSAIN